MHLHLDAGKDAVFVWGAYALSALALAALTIESLLAARRWRQPRGG